MLGSTLNEAFKEDRFKIFSGIVQFVDSVVLKVYSRMRHSELKKKLLKIKNYTSNVGVLFDHTVVVPHTEAVRDVENNFRFFLNELNHTRTMCLLFGFVRLILEPVKNRECV